MDTTMAHQRKLCLVSAIFRSTKTIWLKLRGSGTSTVTTNYPYCSTCNSPMCCKRPSTIWIFVVQIAQLSFFPQTLAISHHSSPTSHCSHVAFSKFSGTQLSGCGVFARPRYHVKPVRCCPCSKYYHILRMTQPRLRQKEEIPYINMSCNIRESTKCDVYFIYKIDHYHQQTKPNNTLYNKNFHMLHRTIETAIMKVSATKLFFDIFWTAAFSLSLSSGLARRRLTETPSTAFCC